MATSSLILQSYLKTLKTDEKSELRYEDKVEELLEYNSKAKGGDFLAPLSFYLAILENTDEVMLRYMSEENKQKLIRDLQVAYLLLLTQKKYEEEHQKYENIKTYAQHIKRCEELLDHLNYNQVCKEQKRAPSPEHGYASDGYPVKYLSIFLGKELAEMIVDSMDRKTKTIKESMGWFNEKRLYWVWASSLLKVILAALPDDFFNVSQATDVVKAPDPYTGTLSWALYYFRFSLNMFLLLKHTISGPWMSEREKKTPWTERFLTQWDQRKFTLLNDSIWATGNLICFFWLTGKGALGTWGDVLTLALLVFDISMAIWDYEEQKTRHNKEMLAYEEDIKKLKQLISKAEEEPGKEDEKLRIIKEYELQLQGLMRAQKESERNWDLQKVSLYAGIAYAVGLMLAFALLAAPFFPVSGPALLAITITGAVLCLAFTVIYNGVKGGMEVYKAHCSAKEAKEGYNNKIELFKLLLEKNPSLDDNEKKFLFLEIKKLKAETEYQKQMVVFQTMHLLRSVILESFIPAVVFASFVFLPLGIGFAVLGATIGVALATNLMINAAFKPAKNEVKAFDEKEYEAFCKDPDNWDKPSKSKQGFFQPKEKKPLLDTIAAKTQEKENDRIDLLDDESSVPLLLSSKNTPNI
ncbi:TPA: lpg2888 family Dot/Icm T4SS effector [Legionella pneumophila]|uniref:Lpg2888 family Dot/Icm T4SS effector n=1 Tax=Legionella pneumophila TaxID=446 RepID=A0AAP3MBR7_LEGPN|nr:lpg2888 family Dot/Icm T4SS effector [Legionella pneumophila]HAT9012694.1 lpg2888 family Dot/Icm T4SS effector [Legionella pneumophila subsp. pneumophila]MCZ4691302.1 lpg2888 family Dot/Icm T4SS effector [Legionella pneumophila]MCZ4710082.1 lpg2888 family Dot/Icm T4SS effector [Legionella pneumophila]MCZ4718606.1 lpg2888 family Dot/Icm T4SS effector [Legionella pneumophila]OOK40242.1 hypothetical protein LPM_2531 [Legionella pneumophila subsp. pneumophila str. Mississauga]